MTNIRKFVPKDELDANVRIEKFISHAKHNYMGVIGLNADKFEKGTWSFDLRILGGKRPKNSHIKFNRFENEAKRGGSEINTEHLITEPIASYFKALLLHRLIIAPTQLISDLNIIIRALEFALRERLADSATPVLLESDDFDRASILVTEGADASAYRRGVFIEKFVEIINELNLTPKAIKWSNPFQKPVEHGLSISKEAENRRQEKMPSDISIRSILQMAIWCLDGDLADHLPVVSFNAEGEQVIHRGEYGNQTYGPLVLGHALCALGLNSRVAELSLMPFNPESFTITKGELDSDGVAEDEDRFALKWVPVKGGSPMVKPFAKAFAPLVELIVRKLKEFSEEPRRIAKHYEKHPDTLYLPEDMEYLRAKKWLSSDDVSIIAGLEPRSVAYWSKDKAIEYREVDASQPGKVKFEYLFADVERAMVNELPSGFPYLNGSLKYSEAMFVCFNKQAAATYNTCRVIPSVFKPAHFENSIGIRVTEGHHKTIFDIFNFYEEDGSRININTHDFRMFWHTQLKHEGVSELIAAYAAGRADPNQNEHYEGMEPFAIAKKSFDVVDLSKSKDFEFGALALVHEALSCSVKHDSKGKQSVVSFSKNSIVTFNKDSEGFDIQGCHMTDYGICGHNYASSGCQKFLDCLSCDELHCIKGIKEFELNAVVKAVKLKAQLREYMEQVSSDVEDDIPHADKWLDMAKAQLNKLEWLINDFYKDPSVPSGAVVQLSADMKNTSMLAESIIEGAGVLINARDSKSRLGFFAK